MHHSTFLHTLIRDGKIKPVKQNKTITYHDPCYLGRANNIYETPRYILKKLFKNLKELKHNQSKSLCCGAGGGQIFKDSEKGKQDINLKRSQEILDTKADNVALACPFCMTMINDGLQEKGKKNIPVKDIAEWLMENQNHSNTKKT